MYAYTLSTVVKGKNYSPGASMHPCRDRQRHRTLVSNTEAEEIRWKTTRSPEALPTLLHPPR